ncbi:hypothetical protein SESBI_09088 [Sesbania bispinosa]|nr:hypothetical protein SESBI_09088 [Sesbania bispinosa]
MDLTNDLHMDPQAISVLEGSLASAEEVDSSQKQKRARKKRAKKKKKQFLLGDSSLKTDTAIKDPSHESLALPDSLSSQGIEECNERRKRKKTEHNAVESNANGCGSPENIFPSKTSIPALDMPSDHPIQCVSTKSVTRQSCMEADNCQGENEEKEQHMLKKAAESSNGECDVQDVSCNCNSAIANGEFSAKESVLESVKMKIEHSINDHSLNPEEKSGFVKNVSVTTKQDDYPAVCDSSDKVQNVKTYTRRKTFNFNCNKEPAVQDHRKDDLHKFSDGPFTVGLMEGETKFSGDQVTSHGGPAAEEMKLMTENTSGKRLMTTSSVVDIPVMQLEETNARQLDHAEITRNDLCCPGDVSDLSLVTVNGGNSKISQFSLDRTIISYSKNKLLILDVNGLLADFVTDVPRRYKPDPEPDLWLNSKKGDMVKYCVLSHC